MKTIHDALNKQINFLDERFYTKDNENFYPSVTHILDVYPKGFGFVQWLKDMGNNADDVVKRAAEQGSKIHDAIDRYLQGEKLEWASAENKEYYNLNEWMMILKFVEFWTIYKPEVIANEEQMLSESLGFGGTIDLVCKMNGQIWLIDHKSGNSLHKSHELQLSAYAMMWNEQHPQQKIERTAIMHLQARTRGPSAGKIQGKGWELKEFERKYEDGFRVFLHVQALWKEENPNPKPKNLVYPDFVQLQITDKKV